SMAEYMRTELIGDALTMAHTHGRIESGALFHSDRGSQYTSDEYAKLAGRFGVRLSVGRTGVCWDNSVAESWFS
ncbi:DDE-type integrase/transposase/recombinase, partial [Microbacterium lacticum]|uniref:DDE-type integrase/transposase/recombinase n=1 Tax=Microbacterium lacticum TaxID=33885 RepID=UPI0018B05556|nr:DDE-type integrase/transposase/recombinase [Microbacterium lacticum]